MRRLAASLVAMTLLMTMPAIGDQVALGAAAATTTTVVSNHNPSVHGESVTFTATVTNQLVTNYIGTGISSPVGIAAGPDGALWFANNGNDSIGRISTAGEVTNYTDSSISGVYAIAAGPDGALWFTNYSNNSIGRIDPTTGTVTNFTDPSFVNPYGGIVTGSDGALWFHNSYGAGYGTIGRITTAGDVIDYGLSGTIGPYGIAAGPDGALWFTGYLNNMVGRITTAGVVTNYFDSSFSAPEGIAAGSDGALWFTNYGNNSIGRISTTGTVTNYTGTGISNPLGIATGPDGALWFTNPGNNSIGRITTAGAVTNYTGTNISQPYFIAAGPDGALWFTNVGNNSIGRIGLAGISTSTVEFKDGDTTIPGCGTAALNGSGQATCGPLTDLAVGDHTITAIYSGDANFTTSTSAALTQTVTSSAVDTTLPVTSNVTAVLRAGGQVSSGPLLLSWTASDEVTPVTDLVHQIQIRRLKHGVWGPWNNVATVTNTQLETVRPLWRHYQYRVQTRDQAGNWGAWAESAPIVLLRRDEGRFRKGSGWTTLPMAGAMRGTVAQSSIIGSWARLRFYGNGVALVMPTGAGLGSVEVCLDPNTVDRQCQNVDLSTFTPTGQRRLVAVFSGLTFGLHHLLVTVTGGTVDLDGALISR